jgi:hypothetical protein
MKQNVSPGVIAVIAVILVAIIGFAAFKKFGSNSNPALTTDSKKDDYWKKQNLKGMGSEKPVLGSPGTGGAAPGGQ